MVHNGIEYGDMQLICEIYDIMRKVLKMPNEVMSTVFSDWNKGELCSYLIEITANILNYRDTDGSYLIDKIADTAAQKGTGKWAGMTALSESVPLTLITESVYARCLSSQRTQRTETAEVFSGIQTKAPNAAETSVAEQSGTFAAGNEILRVLHDALYAAKIISYAQGFELIKTADVHHSWGIDLGGLALLWRGGCIIRSVFLEKISEAYIRNKDLRNLIADTYFSGVLRRTQLALRQAVTFAVLNGVPVPALSSALAWFDGIRCTHLPANLLQAQRDYFGAHTYERTDKAPGAFFHTNWTGCGGETSSTSYTV
jgi:6-phosphogluconate dehydrogenase, C-terminal domain